MAGADRRVPESKREFFQAPLGKALSEEGLSSIDTKRKLITVGDVVSLAAREHGIVPDLSIYDGMTERRGMTRFADLVRAEGREPATVRNPAGTITAELFAAVENALTGKERLIRVEGEEDLAVIPCILLSPDGTNIVYGWPGKGMMVVTTDEAVREEARSLMRMTEELE
ncbi:MAG: GTP-dependent dephospho-CoA kinase family protein [Candidatus Methanoplasma sp.]|nr:GTP-dependent dephospho-CoA kinase family protein [Candidatus Methanoplasma sp.]